MLYLLYISLSFSIVTAQPQIVITLGIPEAAQIFINDALFDEFYSQYPSVKVVVVTRNYDTLYQLPSPQDSLGNHLDDLRGFVETADVLLVNRRTLSVEGTAAGYYLDLRPLIDSTEGIDSRDYYEPIWNSFQWNQGVWAIPTAASLRMLRYNSNQLVTLGYGQTPAEWSMESFESVVRQIALIDSDGTILSPGFYTYRDLGLLIRSLYGVGFYDSNLPEGPFFDTPDLHVLFDGFEKLIKSGLVAFTEDVSSHEIQPLRISSVRDIVNAKDIETLSLLPGGYAGLEVDGFAISAGTQHPEIAFDLIAYLSHQVETARINFRDVPARHAFFSVENGFPISERTTPFIELGLQNALPESEIRYADYITALYRNFRTDDFNADTLAQAQKIAQQNLKTAVQWRARQQVVVATPASTPQLLPGEITLHFGFNLQRTPPPELDEWQATAEWFAQSDPEIGYIDLVSNFILPSQADTLDCYYLPYNAVTLRSPALHLALDPLINTSVEVDTQDILPLILEQLQYDGATYGFPLVIRPATLYYDPVNFNTLSIPTPDATWTTADFTSALEILRANYSGKPVFSANGLRGYELQMLVASNGGLLFDYTSIPPTMHFSETSTIDATQYTLNLVRDGVIASSISDTFVTNTPIIVQKDNFTYVEMQSNAAPSYNVTSFPAGDRYQPLMIQIGAAYINPTSPNPEACFRWIQALAKKPNLFGQLTAFHTQVDDLAATVPWSSSEINYNRSIRNILQDPTVILFPDSTPYADARQPLDYTEEYLLNAVFLSYLNGDENLHHLLSEAEESINDYRNCKSLIVPPEYVSGMSFARVREINTQYEQAKIGCSHQIGVY